jgi:hypothetical protein
MSSPGVHNQIIKSVAKEILQPFGFIQRGRSRLWIADNGWWLVLVEFQPSSWSRGTYLNVGAKFLWSGDNVFSFDFSFGVSARLGKFCEFVDGERFAVEVRRLAELASNEAQRLRQEFATMEGTADSLATRVLSSPWGLYHAAAAAILAGRTEKGRAFLDELQRIQGDTKSLYHVAVSPGKVMPEWRKSFYDAAGSLSSVSNEPAKVADALANCVRHSRKLLKLPEWRGQLGSGNL